MAPRTANQTQSRQEDTRLPKTSPVWPLTKSYWILRPLSRKSSLPSFQPDRETKKWASKNSENETQSPKRKENVGYVWKNAQRGIGVGKLQTAYKSLRNKITISLVGLALPGGAKLLWRTIDTHCSLVNFSAWCWKCFSICVLSTNTLDLEYSQSNQVQIVNMVLSSLLMLSRLL